MPAGNEILAMRLEIDGDRIVQSDSLRIVNGDVVSRTLAMECFLYEFDRSRRLPTADPEVLRDMIGCHPTPEAPGHGGYGQYAVTGDLLTFSLPSAGEMGAFRLVLRRVE